MNNCDERIEELLNRAGQTISDLPRKQGASVSEPYSGEYRKKANGSAWRWYLNIDDSDMDDYESIRSTMVLKLYILHLTDVIDRLENALENQVTLHENLMHVIGNADIPDGVSYDQFYLVVDSIYRAVQTAQEGWENYEDGVPKDGSPSPVPRETLTTKQGSFDNEEKI